MARVTQAMLERAVGGAARLVQLLDKDNDGVADSALVADCLDGSQGEVNSAIALAVDLSDTTIDTAPVVLRHQTAIAAFLAWQRGAGGQAMPDEIRVGRDEAMEWLDRVAQRKRGIGIATRPTASQPVQQVTKADTEAWFSTVGPRRRFDGWS